MEMSELTINDIQELLTQERDEQGLNASPSITLAFILLEMLTVQTARADAADAKLEQEKCAYSDLLCNHLSHAKTKAIDKLREIRERFVQDVSTRVQYHRDVGYLLGMMDIETARADRVEICYDLLAKDHKNLLSNLQAETARADAAEAKIKRARIFETSHIHLENGQIYIKVRRDVFKAALEDKP